MGNEGTGTYLDTNERETRFHNDANELQNRDPNGDGLGPIDLDFDPAGNIEHAQPAPSATTTYTHDAWNRLVKVARDGLPWAEYE